MEELAGGAAEARGGEGGPKMVDHVAQLVGVDGERLLASEHPNVADDAGSRSAKGRRRHHVSSSSPM